MKGRTIPQPPRIAAAIVGIWALTVAAPQAHAESVGQWSFAEGRDGREYAWLHADQMTQPESCAAWVEPTHRKGPARDRIIREGMACFVIACEQRPGRPTAYNVWFLLSGGAPKVGERRLDDRKALNIVLGTDGGPFALRTIVDDFISGITVYEIGASANGALVEFWLQPEDADLEQVMAAKTLRIGPIRGRYATDQDVRALDIGEYLFQLGNAAAAFARLQQRCKHKQS